MRNRTFLQLTLAIEMQFRPKFIRLAMELLRQAIRALKEGGVDYARGKLSTIQLDVYPVLLAIYRKAGVFGARFAAKELDSKLTARDKVQIAAHRKAHGGL